MNTEIRRQYENKTFPKGKLKKFGLKACRFLNIVPWDGCIFLREKDEDFEISSKITIDELNDICELGTGVFRLDFHLSYNIIKICCRPGQVLDVLYVINGNREYSERFIFFAENLLELKKLPEATDQQQSLALDQSVLKLLEQVYERERVNRGGWTLEKYLHQVIQAHCREVLGSVPTFP
ncbi:hypothetical protein Desor_2723 [Desulfosporosinus orientis DSM 765]|uniref:Uncharacterized protein n=1 Tax=Desulfosporosinus orientis (strain ATCC 19365 / DSM 765 / NCIMB 8382 / VKM B-1628 / Singapore I) TaxID=768706 RepID=G7WBD6_DESOD|nr:hypothetical protein [Desulfosporosinus orientis]AET68265.1 hypothetical protein Desor_2723 [Desulfosporosinus orientis DSM 765]